MKKRVLLASQYTPNDTTSLLRAWGPFSLMREEVEIVRVPKTEKMDWFRDWHYWFEIDVCFLHRPSQIYYNHVAHYAKLHGIPVWVDHDDDLLKITSDNPHYSAYETEENKQSVRDSYKYADVLTCSSKNMYEELKTVYGREDAILITTGLDDRLLRLKKPWTRNAKVGWRGSKSHLSDLLAFQPQITNLMGQFPKTQWYFWGINPFFLDWHGEMNLKWNDQLNLMPFLHSMTHENASLHMVPLIDNAFNRVKSHLSWLDATLAGSVVIGPDFPEWNLPGILHYKKPSEFDKVMVEAMHYSDETLKTLHDESWEYIHSNLLQSKLNLKRREILKNL